MSEKHDDDVIDAGPEQPEGPVGAVDGEPVGGRPGLRSVPDPDSIAGRAVTDQGETTEDDDGQIAFVVKEGPRRVNTGNLVKASTPNQLAYKLTGKALPKVTGGIIDPYLERVPLIVNAAVGGMNTAYLRDDDRAVKSARQTVDLNPYDIQLASTENGVELFCEAMKDVTLSETAREMLREMLAAQDAKAAA